jgi:hypothetical protein
MTRDKTRDKTETRSTTKVEASDTNTRQDTTQTRGRYHPVVAPQGATF